MWRSPSQVKHLFQSVAMSHVAVGQKYKHHSQLHGSTQLIFLRDSHTQNKTSTLNTTFTKNRKCSKPSYQSYARIHETLAHKMYINIYTKGQICPTPTPSPFRPPQARTHACTHTFSQTHTHAHLLLYSLSLSSTHIHVASREEKSHLIKRVEYCRSLHALFDGK